MKEIGRIFDSNNRYIGRREINCNGEIYTFDAQNRIVAIYDTKHDKTYDKNRRLVSNRGDISTSLLKS